MNEESRANGKAIASMIISIVSILCCCVWYVGLIVGVVALVLGILAYRDENPNQKDMAIAGIVVGATGVAVAVAVAVMDIYILQQQSAIEAMIENGTRMLM